MKTFSKNSLLFVGDIHGNFSWLYTKLYNFENALIIQVGDAGIGFESQERDRSMLNILNEFCKPKGIDMVFIRGNHDNKGRFEMFRKLNAFSNIHFPEDYETISCNQQTIQFIGGATSIDRTSRTINVDYWTDEVIEFDVNKCQKVDILVTHTAPSFCYPQGTNSMVEGWAAEDRHLLTDLKLEREQMTKLLYACNPKLHMYGHFHDFRTEVIDDCKHKLLGINEIWEYRQ